MLNKDWLKVWFEVLKELEELLKPLKKYQFGIPKIFNCFAFLISIITITYISFKKITFFSLEQSVLIGILGVVLLFGSFIIGYCYKQQNKKQKHKKQTHSFWKTIIVLLSLIIYVVGFSLIPSAGFLIYNFSKYYLLKGKVLIEKEPINAKKNIPAVDKTITLKFNHSNDVKKTKTNSEGNFEFTLTINEIRSLNRVEVEGYESQAVAGHYFNKSWPNAEPDSFNDPDKSDKSEKPNKEFIIDPELLIIEK